MSFLLTMARRSKSQDDLRRQHVVLAVAAVILCTQLQVAKMIKKNAQPKAQWNPNEIDAFLTYLISVKSAMAGTSFKDVTFNEAVQQIASNIRELAKKRFL